MARARVFARVAFPAVCNGLLSLRNLGTQHAHVVLALDHACVRVAIAAHAQPLLADPDAVARDDRFSSVQPGTTHQCSRQIVDGIDLAQERVERSPDPRPWRAGSGRQLSALAVLPDQETHLPGIELVEDRRDGVETIDAYSLEVTTKDGFDRTLPALLHTNLLCEARPLSERVRGEPFHDAALRLSKRGLLQGLE